MTFRTSLFSAALLLSLGLAACGDDSESDEPGGAAGTSTQGGSGGSPSTGGSGGQPQAGSGGRPQAGNGGGGAGGGNPVSAEFEALKACRAPDPCEKSFAQFIENSMRNVNQADARCVLRGLRDRTPGLYEHGTDHTFSNGSIGANHLMLVSADGGVRYARDVYGRGFETDPPAQRCQLADPSFFASCLTALDAPDGATSDATWSCLFGDGDVLEPSRLNWFTSCVAEAPRCE
ncbi:MAG TPA: hypothetical protein VFS43_09115 [Polyangiaceae bacterium]|nr:hypothetical protein [Polyangiaceae bacterium]